jgi:peptidoglycan/xylan/chitin deacetylase (PgdA/CDA1 family)
MRIRHLAPFVLLACCDASPHESPESELDEPSGAAREVETDSPKKPSSVPGDPAGEAPREFGIPVLLLHSVCATTCEASDIYGMSKGDLDALLDALDARGYTSVSSADFARFRRGAAVPLPARPIYLTFDDARASAYVNATPVLESHRARATMFVITKAVGSGDRYFMSWDDVAAAAAGPWDLELHAHAGHTFIRTGQDSLAHFYAARESAYSGRNETHEQWQARVESDIESGERELHAHLPSWTPHSFAVPYGDYGQANASDPQIRGDLATFLDQRYAAWFVQAADPAFASAGGPPETQRYVIRNTTTVPQVLSWLTKHEPAIARRR